MASTKDRTKAAVAAGTEKVRKSNAGKQSQAVKETQKKAKDAVLELAKKIAGTSIEDQIAAVQKNVNSSLAELSATINDKINQFTSLDAAIAIRQAELDELHGIQAQADTLAGLIEAIEATKAEQEQVVAEHEVRLKEIHDEITNRRAEAQKAHKELLEAQGVERMREEENWRYNFNRTKTQKMDELQDELNRLRKTHNEAVDADRKALTAERDELEAWESRLEEREEEFNSLKTQVASFPATLEAAKNDAFEKGESKGRQSVYVELASTKKQYEGELKVKEAENAALQREVETLKAQLAKSEAALERAQSEATSLAKAAIDGAKPLVTYLGGNSTPSQTTNGR